MPRKKKTRHLLQPYAIRWRPETLIALRILAAERKTTMAKIIRGLVEREIHKAQVARH